MARKKPAPSIADVKAKSAETSSLRDVLGPIFDAIPPVPEPWYRRHKPAQNPNTVQDLPMRHSGKAFEVPKPAPKPAPGPDQYAVEDATGVSSVFKTELNARNYITWLDSRYTVSDVVLRRCVDNAVWDWEASKWVVEVQKG